MDWPIFSSSGCRLVSTGHVAKLLTGSMLYASRANSGQRFSKSPMPWSTAWVRVSDALANCSKTALISGAPPAWVTECQNGHAS